MVGLSCVLKGGWTPGDARASPLDLYASVPIAAADLELFGKNADAGFPDGWRMLLGILKGRPPLMVL
jgi:hypothetical protein